MLGISENQIAEFSKYIYKISGIYLDKSKGYLLETRLKGLAAEYGATSYGVFLDQIKADSTKQLEKKLIDAISTNETFFFRDNVPFDLLRNKIIPDLIDLRKKQNSAGTIPIKIWSAACSTGQEVYSIAITLLEMLSGMGSYELSILGTDISNEVIAKASYGQYNRFEIERGLPGNMRHKYFTQSGEGWRIRDEVRSLVIFEKINLMQPFPVHIGPFDVVFCRNVAIYFQKHDKLNLFKKIARISAPSGSLIVGGSENLSAIAPDFVSQQYLRGIYYTLKRDKNIKKQAPVQNKPLGDKKPIPVSPKRKTVYDKKRSIPVAKVEKVSLKKQTKADLSNPKNNIQKPSASTTQNMDPKQKPVSLAKQSENGAKEQKTSLLSSIQKKQKQSFSLLDNKGKAKDSKRSLLDKVRQQKGKEV